MISYDSLRDKMKEKGISQYALIRRWHINPAQITRLKRNESVSPHTIEMFCKILKCEVGTLCGIFRTGKRNGRAGRTLCRFLPVPRPDSTLRRQNSRAGDGQTA